VPLWQRKRGREFLSLRMGLFSDAARQNDRRSPARLCRSEQRCTLLTVARSSRLSLQISRAVCCTVAFGANRLRLCRYRSAEFSDSTGCSQCTDTRQRLRILCWVGVADRLPNAGRIEWRCDIIESSRSRPPGTESPRQRRSTSVSGMRRPDAFSGAIYGHPRGCHGDTARLGV
jgi:hypothetical protein